MRTKRSPEEILALARPVYERARKLNMSSQDLFYLIKAYLELRCGVPGFDAMVAAFCLRDGMEWEHARRLAGSIIQKKRRRRSA